MIISDEEIQGILRMASINNIKCVDSAQAYGDANKARTMDKEGDEDGDNK